MGTKLAWLGLFFLLAGPAFGIPFTQMVGAIIMAIGVIMMLLNV